MVSNKSVLNAREISGLSANQILIIHESLPLLVREIVKLFPVIETRWQIFLQAAEERK